jgi:hypothetical protein
VKKLACNCPIALIGLATKVKVCLRAADHLDCLDRTIKYMEVDIA